MNIRADRVFFYLLLLLVTLLTLVLVWRYMGSVVLALTVAVVLQPMHDWFLRRTGERKGPATALTMLTTVVLVVIPVLIGTVLFFESFTALSADVIDVMQTGEHGMLDRVRELDRWLSSTGIAAQLQLEEEQVTLSIREFFANASLSFARWLATVGFSTFNLVVPMVLFFSLLGTLLTNSRLAVQLFKEISPLDDAIDQLFMDRLRIMTVAMMRSIVVAAVVQGVVTGLLMALAGTPHIIPLTLLAILFSILPGGAAIVAVPVGLIQIWAGDIWGGLLVIFGTITFVASLDNQVRPLLISKDAYLNRAFVLLSVFGGVALFGFMGVVYGPLIMILFSTVLEVYLKYYRPGPPEVTLVSVDEAKDEPEIEVGVTDPMDAPAG